MRLLKFVVSISILLALALGFTPLSSAAPLCSQINANDFCYPCNGGTVVVQFQGDCATEDREWRCFWSGCESGNGPSPWIPCGCPGSGEGCDCLLAGTPIKMADGSSKPVEKILVGDMVMGFDERTGVALPRRVSAVHKPFTADGYFVINESLKVTETHPFLSSGGWINTSELKVGDVIAGDVGSTQIFRVRKVEEPALAFNFTVEGGTYLAAGMVVHNKEICEHFIQYPSP